MEGHFRINNNDGYCQAVLEDAKRQSFGKVAKQLEKSLGIKFKSKMEGLDEIYWDFDYMGSEYTLHFQNYLGVIIFPKKMAKSTKKENDLIAEIAERVRLKQ